MKRIIRLYIILLCSLQLANATENGTKEPSQKLYVSNSLTVYGLENLHVNLSAEILVPKVSQTPKTNPLKAYVQKTKNRLPKASATPILHAFPTHPFQDISQKQLVSCAVLPTNPTTKNTLFSIILLANALQIEDSQKSIGFPRSLSPDHLLLPQDYASNFGAHSPPVI